MLAGTFVEVLCAPDYEEAAMAALTVQAEHAHPAQHASGAARNPGERDLRRVVGGLLVQDRDAESEDRSRMTVVTERAPTEAEWGDLLFAWRVAKHVKSNAIVIARDLATVGRGRRADEPRRLGAPGDREGPERRSPARRWPATPSSRSPTAPRRPSRRA